MSRRFALALLGGCGGDPATADGGRGDYAGRTELEAEFVDPERPDGQPWLLRVEEDRWEVRAGERWADGTVLGQWAVDRADGLWLDDVRMLPANAEQGAAVDGVRVDRVGAVAVYYGTFPDAVETTVTGGDRLDGSHAFAKDIGPIRLTIGGMTRELAFYW
jgi:hypothetical protein